MVRDFHSRKVTFEIAGAFLKKFKPREKYICYMFPQKKPFFASKSQTFETLLEIWKNYSLGFRKVIGPQ